ncbi:hypothetical protein DNU06_16235 [Putridiphycobacter roseus]|uniref:Lipoprotein n=2 Tax=Putridiphycobacter roseus TaxID=2219161 RepID=A0A2W1MXC5_9FLAO|nr:hypothetical protein DNU06_16235 [Putridiphycobacter roseus]
MKINPNILVLTICTFSLLACKKDQAEIAAFNKNCSCAEEVSAEFLIENVSNFSNYSVDTDSCHAGRNIRFTAIEENANYTWYIGAEVLTERSFVRFFPTDLAGQSIPISLKVEKTPNTICLPYDDGLDSTERFLGIADPYNSFDFYNTPQPQWEGTFRMKEEGGKDSVDIKVYLGEGRNTLGEPFQDLLIFENLRGTNDSLQFQTGAAFYNIILTNGNAIGVGCLDDGYFKRFYQNNTYEIFLPKEETEYCSNRKTYHLKGRKIN